MRMKITTFSMMVVLTAALISCGSNGDCFDKAGFDAFGKNVKEHITAYSQKDLEKNAEESKNIHVYIDFSDGMLNAYSSENNKMMLDKMASQLTDNALWFNCSEENITEMGTNGKEIYTKIFDKTMYTKGAPIEKTLKKIVEDGEEAIFVTDFEEYENGKIRSNPWAAPYFVEWVKKDNSITFYKAEDFVDLAVKGKPTKHLFFVVFNTPAKKAMDAIEYAWRDRGYKWEKYELTSDICTMSTEYPSNSKGGIYYDDKGEDVLFVVDEANFLNASSKKFEFYPCNTTWNNLFKYSNDYKQAGTPKPFSHVFRNLFININGDEAYSLDKIDVRVTDVTDDYLFFCKANEVRKHQPKMTKDESGNPMLAEDNDAIALTCYDQTGKLNPEWEYKAKVTPEVKEFFVIDEELFKNGKADGSKAEVGLKWHPNFNGSQISNPTGLYRVDIFIKECTEQVQDLNSFFGWEGNDSFAESVRKTLKDTNPQGKVIYSYFIRMNLED